MTESERAGGRQVIKSVLYSWHVSAHLNKIISHPLLIFFVSRREIWQHLNTDNEFFARGIFIVFKCSAFYILQGEKQKQYILK